MRSDELESATELAGFSGKAFGPSAGRIYFISEGTLRQAVSGKTMVADAMFTVASPNYPWPRFVANHKAAGQAVLAETRRRIQASVENRGKPHLDLEAVAIAPSGEGQ